MRRGSRPLVCVTFLLALLGCQDRAQSRATDGWIGQWNGPEGTFLRLDGGDGTYAITIQDLDGPRNYTGTAVDGRIEFERNGVKESIHASNGTETGMKWLAEKSDCLTIRPGEGFCRD